jgi:hypothetical protein
MNLFMASRHLNEMAPVHFLVTGALDSPMGLVSSKVRQLQTLQTFESIRAVLPSARIHYVDAGATSRDSSLGLEDIGLHVDSVLDLRGSDFVAEKLSALTELSHSNTTQSAITKSLLESYSYQRFFSSKDLPDVDGIVLKLSARYKIGRRVLMNLRSWVASDLPYLSSKARKSYLKSATVSSLMYRRTVLWGLRSRQVSGFLKINEDMMALLGAKSLSDEPFDLEHAFCSALPNESIFGVNRLYVSGQVASFGRTIRL